MRKPAVHPAFSRINGGLRRGSTRKENVVLTDRSSRRSAKKSEDIPANPKLGYLSPKYLHMKYLSLLTLAALVFAGCDKDDNEPTKTELLTSSAWQYDNGGVDQDRNGTVDVSFAGVLPACVLDNKATFNANGSGVGDEGSTKCQTTDPQTTPFNWAFTNNEQNIQMNGTGLFGIGGNFKVTALTSSQLGLQKDTTISGFTVSMIVNLKH
jgi:hypothetical protein